MTLNRPPAKIDWTPYLAEGEELLWTGASRRSRMIFVMLLGILFFGLCTWFFSRYIFQYHSLAEACGATASRKCRSLYNFPWPYFLGSLLLTLASVLALALQALGLHKQYYAITSGRALQVVVGLRNWRASVDLSEVAVRRTFLGAVEFGARKYPKMTFYGLTNDEVKDAVYWANKGAAAL